MKINFENFLKKLFFLNRTNFKRPLSLPFCQPADGVTYQTLNLGEVLRGDRIVNTAYDVRMGDRVDCQIICEIDIDENDADRIIGSALQ